MFRYLALFDPNVGIVLFRDIDNVYTTQHHYFVDEWIKYGEDISVYMNENYKHKQISDSLNYTLSECKPLNEDEQKYYTTILSGLLNVRKEIGEAFSVNIWQKMFAYLEGMSTLSGFFTLSENVRFTYGFDELALTRVAIPIFMESNLSIRCIPIRIYDKEYIENMFENPILTKFLRNLSDDATLQIVKKIIVDEYWLMNTPNAGLSQYMLCIITNIYFGIITNKSKFYINSTFIENIKNKIIPNPLLMSIGMFTFKNYKRYNWYPISGKSSCGSFVVDNFLLTNKKITIEEWTCGSNLAASPSPGSGDGVFDWSNI